MGPFITAYRNEYYIWASIKKRCKNPKDPAYHNYGGRGITICEHWRTSFLNFFSDMGPRPPGMTLDRINNDGNYEPGNCRWTDRITQMNNMRTNLRITHQGETLTRAQWERRLGFCHGLIRSRLAGGWSLERAMTVKPYEYRNRRHC